MAVGEPTDHDENFAVPAPDAAESLTECPYISKSGAALYVALQNPCSTHMMNRDAVPPFRCFAQPGGQLSAFCPRS